MLIRFDNPLQLLNIFTFIQNMDASMTIRTKSHRIRCAVFTSA